MARIALIDDHYVVRVGLKYMLQLDPSLVFAGEAEDAMDIGFVGQTRADIVLMDLMLPGKEGLTAFHEIRAAYPDVKVIILTTSSKEEDVFRCVSAGVDGYVPKDSKPTEIVKAIRAVAGGERYFPDRVREIFALREGEKGVSSRELEMLRYIAKGMTNVEISELAGVSVETVKSHLKSLFAKLGVTDRAEAVAVAIARGILGDGR